MRYFYIFISLLSLTLFSSNRSGDNNTSNEMIDWELDWSEEFDTSDLDTTIWSIIKRGKYDWNKNMSDNPKCFGYKDGCIILKGLVNKDFAQDTSKYITGGISTKGKKSFGPGRLEIRAKLNGAKGAWPAIWLWPFEAEKGWPWDGEIDIVERLNYDDYVYQTLHDYFITTLKNNKPKRIVKAPFNKDDFNVFGVDILEDRLEFHVNGVVSLSYPRIDSLQDIGQYPFYREWFLHLDMQLGGKWVGEVEDKDLPVEMEIDWVRHYRKKEE